MIPMFVDILRDTGTSETKRRIVSCGIKIFNGIKWTANYLPDVLFGGRSIKTKWTSGNST